MGDQRHERYRAAKPKSPKHEIKLKQRRGFISMRLTSGSGATIGMQAMLALFSLPVELLGLAIVFISVMAGILAAAAE
jgi:hypothetical protein